MTLAIREPMLPFRFFSANHTTYRAVMGLALSLPIALSVWMASRPLQALSLSDYRSYQCSTQGASTKPTFKILTLFYNYATDFADYLCASALFAKSYSGVEIRWRPRAYLSPQHILDEEFDIFWNRHHIVAGLVPEFSNYYRVLQQTPNYALYWISQDSTPQLNSDYLQGKAIGFSRDSQSQTHFLQPMAALKQAGINLNADQKKFYTDPSALYAAFKNREVDMISTAISQADNLNLSTYYTLLINPEVPSGAWFIKNQLHHSHHRALECEIIRGLQVYAPLLAPLQQLSAQTVDCP